MQTLGERNSSASTGADSRVEGSVAGLEDAEAIIYGELAGHEPSEDLAHLDRGELSLQNDFLPNVLGKTRLSSAKQ